MKIVNYNAISKKQVKEVVSRHPMIANLLACQMVCASNNNPYPKQNARFKEIAMGVLSELDIEFKTNNGGSHLIATVNNIRINWYPTTAKMELKVIGATQWVYGNKEIVRCLIAMLDLSKTSQPESVNKENSFSFGERLKILLTGKIERVQS